MTNGLRILAVLSATGLAGVTAVGCASSGKAAALIGPVVPITESDFHISAPSTLKTGNYTLRVANKGPTYHEFIVAPTRSGSLPLRPDGLTVDEEAIERSEPGSLEPGAPGAVRDLTLHLKPGRYILFCNMEGHYMAGMHTELTVR